MSLKDELDMTFMKFKVAPSHNNADYFKGFFYSGYKYREKEISHLNQVIKDLSEGCIHGGKEAYRVLSKHQETIKKASE